MKEKVDVKILSKNKGENNKIHKEIKKYRLLERTIFLNIPQNIMKRIVYGFFVFAKVFSVSPKIALKSINILKYKKEALSLVLLFATHSFLNKKDKWAPDIIHSHFGPNGKLAVFMKDIGVLDKKTLIITSFYGYDISGYVKNNREDVYNFLFKKCDSVIAISKHMKNELIKIGCPEEKIFIQHLGVNPDGFKFKKKAPNSKKIKILTVARMVEKKGLEYSIKAFSKAINRHKINAEYFIIGDGPLKNKIELLISRLGIKKKVHVLGWRTREEVKNFMKKSDIFMLTSITAKNGDKEGTPTAILEAMSSGLPIISTFHAGIPEQVKNGVSGILVPEKNINEIEKAISFLVQNPALRLDMGKKGRTLVEKNFNSKFLNKSLLKLYRELLSQMPKKREYL